MAYVGEKTVAFARSVRPTDFKVYPPLPAMVSNTVPSARRFASTWIKLMHVLYIGIRACRLWDEQASEL